MAEETSQPAQPSVNVLAQYIRDLSFENILAQKGVSGDVTPDIQIQVKLTHVNARLPINMKQSSN